jgi:L-threonylcarbamoyladenylate synthase
MDKFLVTNIIENLKKEAVICLNTDTIFGLLAKADSQKAIDNIYQLKSRPKEKTYSLLVNNLLMASKYFELDSKDQKILSLPFSVTLILDVKSNNKDLNYLSRESKLAIRIPKSESLRSIIEEIDFPVIATSANISGKTPIKNIEEAKELFGNKVKYFLLEQNSTNIESAILIKNANKYQIIRASKDQKEILEKYV